MTANDELAEKFIRKCEAEVGAQIDGGLSEILSGLLDEAYERGRQEGLGEAAKWHDEKIASFGSTSITPSFCIDSMREVHIGSATAILARAKELIKERDRLKADAIVAEEQYLQGQQEEIIYATNMRDERDASLAREKVLREALTKISELDYLNASINCAAYNAVKIARAALLNERDELIKERDEAFLAGHRYHLRGSHADRHADQLGVPSSSHTARHQAQADAPCVETYGCHPAQQGQGSGGYHHGPGGP
ncbi:MAG: hypothetical protein P4M11_01955 [Candidatus Pacebacteria bacterium]|nr:hypothetical protein [Candidatus Paceibacterota bacterium]